MSPALYVSVSLATCVGLCRFGEAWAALRAENLLTYGIGRRRALECEDTALPLGYGEVRAVSHPMGVGGSRRMLLLTPQGVGGARGTTRHTTTHYIYKVLLKTCL